MNNISSEKKRMPRNVKKKYILMRQLERKRRRNEIKKFIRFEQKILNCIDDDLYIEYEDTNVVFK